MHAAPVPASSVRPHLVTPQSFNAATTGPLAGSPIMTQGGPAAVISHAAVVMPGAFYQESDLFLNDYPGALVLTFR
jgi:hypothetical protein